MKFIVTLLFFISATVNAQELSGVWQGKLTQEPGGCFPEYYIELQIKESGYLVQGVSYDYYDTSTFVKLQFTGEMIAGAKKTMRLVEKKIVQEKIPEDCVPCMKTYTLTYSRKNNEESLSGQWVGEDMGTIAGCPPGNIYLKKVSRSAFAAPTVRKTVLAHTIYVSQPNIHLAFYDNGTVDGDSITVSFDKQTILHNKGLSVKPIEADITLQPAKSHELVIKAETLGSIAPNTSILVVTAGKKRFELFLSASETDNSAVRIIFGRPGDISSESEPANLKESNTVE